MAITRTVGDYTKPGTHAERVLRDVRLDGDDHPDPIHVARELGIRVRCVDRVDMPETPAQIQFPPGGAVIYYWNDLPQPRRDFLVAHEIWHCIVANGGSASPDEEADANLFAGALLVRLDRMTAAWHRWRDLGRMVRHWRLVPPTCVALRLGELGLADVWVLQGSRVLYSRATAPPLNRDINAPMAHGSQSFGRFFWRATVLEDAPHRVALAAASF